jgi:hypothetical protein
MNILPITLIHAIIQIMSTQEGRLAGIDDLPDDMLERFRAYKYGENAHQPPAYVENTGVAREASPAWPLFRNFVTRLGEDASRSRSGESAQALARMNTGEFAQGMGEVPVVDRAAMRKMAGELVNHYGIEVTPPAPQTTHPGEVTQVLPRRTLDNGTTRAFKARPDFLNDPAFRGGETTTVLPDRDHGEATRRLSTAALSSAVSAGEPNRTRRSVGERPGVIGNGYPTAPGEQTYNFAALNHDSPGERTAQFASPAGPGEMTQVIPPVTGPDIVGLDTLLNSSHQVHKI